MIVKEKKRSRAFKRVKRRCEQRSSKYRYRRSSTTLYGNDRALANLLHASTKKYCENVSVVGSLLCVASGRSRWCTMRSTPFLVAYIITAIVYEAVFLCDINLPRSLLLSMCALCSSCNYLLIPTRGNNRPLTGFQKVWKLSLTASTMLLSSELV
jgi:hypothetical protein